VLATAFDDFKEQIEIASKTFSRNRRFHLRKSSMISWFCSTKEQSILNTEFGNTLMEGLE